MVQKAWLLKIWLTLPLEQTLCLILRQKNGLTHTMRKENDNLLLPRFCSPDPPPFPRTGGSYFYHCFSDGRNSKTCEGNEP